MQKRAQDASVTSPPIFPSVLLSKKLAVYPAFMLDTAVIGYSFSRNILSKYW